MDENRENIIRLKKDIESMQKDIKKWFERMEKLFEGLEKRFATKIELIRIQDKITFHDKVLAWVGWILGTLATASIIYLFTVLLWK